jgi:hypothetical protein
MSFTIKRGPVAADNYTIIANALLRDHRLSLKARGLAGWLLSHRADFSLTLPRIAELNGCGEASVRTAVEELEKLGYLQREQARDGGKFGGTTYYITDVCPADDRQTVFHRRENRERENRERENGVHKKTTSQEDHSGDSDADAPAQPALPLPGVQDELERREAEEEKPKPLTLNQMAQRLATVHYEAVQRMGNFMGFRAVMAKALNAGYAPAHIAAAAERLRERNVTLTAAALRAQLEGGPRPATTTGPQETRTASGHILEYR